MLLSETIAPFRLHPDLDPANYVITNNMRDNLRWKAMTYMGDSQYESGSMAQVGYVMISLKDNYIIPISRGDEHHRGYDLLHDFVTGNYPYRKKSKKVNINPSEYFPMWSTGKSYLYHKSEAELLLCAAAKFLQYGGPDGTITMRQDFPNSLMHLSDFVASNGNVTNIEKGSLSKAGERLYGEIKSLADQFATMPRDVDRIQSTRVFTDSAKLIKKCLGMTFDLGIDRAAVKTMMERIRELRKGNNIKELEHMMFGFHSLKNLIHVAIKNPQGWHIDTLRDFWGDIDLAKELLDMI